MKKHTKNVIVAFIISSLIIYSSIITFMHFNGIDSIVTMKVSRKPDFGSTFFIVDSSGTPIPNAELCTDTYSGSTFSTTNESGYCNHKISDYEILSLTVNGKPVYTKRLFHSLDILEPTVFLIKCDP